MANITGLQVSLDVYLSASVSVELDVTKEEFEEMSADQQHNLLRSLIDFEDIAINPNDFRDLEVSDTREVCKKTGLEVTN